MTLECFASIIIQKGDILQYNMVKDHTVGKNYGYENHIRKQIILFVLFYRKMSVIQTILIHFYH